ncbi:MAG: glycosyltransferase [Anaerolineae bacterium]|nr:glycosyltransferase [Anaerolineae bacterium]
MTKKYTTIGVHVTALSLLWFMSYRLWHNLRYLRQAQHLTPSPSSSLPRVSVLVPARNEARNIVSCIESLASQAYPNFEIIVLNDLSSDETGILLDSLATQYPKVRVLHGTEEPPKGWNGKSYACHRLAEQATGEWLLFTDADTVHTSTSVAQGIAQAKKLGAALLSAFPKQITESWGERIVVSFILDFLPLIAVDLNALQQNGSSITLANGQYLLVNAEAYHAIGGHQAIFNELVDDFALAKQVRLGGYKTAMVNGTSMLSCRMYHNTHEVWDGFSKNLMLGLETSATKKPPAWFGPLFAWGYACIFVLPFFYLLSAPRKRLPFLEIGWLAFLRGCLNLYFRRSFLEVMTTPLAAWSVMALGLNALLRRGKEIQWKGRYYKA